MEGGKNEIQVTQQKSETQAARAPTSSQHQRKTPLRNGKQPGPTKRLGESYRICPKPTKQVLKVHKSLRKAASALVVQIRTEKIGLRKFLHSRKVPGFDHQKAPGRGTQSARHILVECRMHTGKRNEILEGSQKESGSRQDQLAGNANPPQICQESSSIYEVTWTDRLIQVRKF